MQVHVSRFANITPAVRTCEMKVLPLWDSDAAEQFIFSFWLSYFTELIQIVKRGSGTHVFGHF